MHGKQQAGSSAGLASEVVMLLPTAVHVLGSSQALYGEYRQFIATFNATEKCS